MISTPNYGTHSTGHEYSAECVAREAELIAACEANVPTGFDDLCRWMGFRPRLLRSAIGKTTSRASVIERIRIAGVRFENADEHLANAFCREVSVSLDMAAE